LQSNWGFNNVLQINNVLREDRDSEQVLKGKSKKKLPFYRNAYSADFFFLDLPKSACGIGLGKTPPPAIVALMR
jgi:hypothetical protein